MRQLRHWALQVESRGDAIKGVKDRQASIEGKTDGNGDSNQNGGMDGTTTSVSIDSMRVDEALLAVSSGPPTNCAERPYGVIRRRRRRGRIKVEPIMVKQAGECETSYLGRARTTHLCKSALSLIASYKNL